MVHTVQANSKPIARVACGSATEKMIVRATVSRFSCSSLFSTINFNHSARANPERYLSVSGGRSYITSASNSLRAGGASLRTASCYAAVCPLGGRYVSKTHLSKYSIGV